MTDPAQRDRVIREALAALPGVAAAWIFGSVARGEARSDSDLNLAVLPASGLGREGESSLRALAAALERWSPSGRVDVLILGDQGPVLRHRILSEGTLLYDADPERRIAFEGRTIAEYLDWKPTHDIAMRSALGGVRDRLERGAS